MKKIFKDWMFLALSVYMSGCSGLIDDVRPDTSIPLPSITTSELPLVVKGMYTRFSNNMYYITSFASDVASDNLTSVYEVANNINFKQYDDCNVSVNDGFIAHRMFAFPYNGIGLANIIINYVDDHKLTDAISTSAKGEALLMRAYCYSLLVERFGGVVITRGTKDDQKNRSQDSEEEVWRFIMSDLNDAIPLLSDFTTPNSASVQAAKGLLARIYLNYGVLYNDPEMVSQAGKLAEQVIDNGGRLALNPDFMQNFVSTGTGKEVIWRMQETMSAPTSDWCLYRFLFPETAEGKPFGSTWMEDNLYRLYNDQNDKRNESISSHFYEALGKEYPYCVKFPADYNPVYVFIRLAEMHLIVAEVAARKGIIDVTEYNAVRSSRNASTKQNSDFASAADFLKEIENERRREFVAEGLRWMDMRRFGVLAAHLSAKGVNTKRVHFPVSVTLIATTPALKQTEYYD